MKMKMKMMIIIIIIITINASILSIILNTVITVIKNMIIEMILMLTSNTSSLPGALFTYSSQGGSIKITSNLVPNVSVFSFNSFKSA